MVEVRGTHPPWDRNEHKVGPRILSQNSESVPGLSVGPKLVPEILPITLESVGPKILVQSSESVPGLSVGPRILPQKSVLAIILTLLKIYAFVPLVVDFFIDISPRRIRFPY